jgi:hypothetical protein
MTWPNPSLMSADELADALRHAEAMAKDLGANWEAQARLFRLRSETAFRKSKIEEEPEMIGNPADEISQREKRRILAEDRQVRASTYLQQAQANVDEDRGGRYAAMEKPSTVIGTSPGPVYPQLPADSPANQAAMVPDEPLIDGSGEGSVLGYAIDRPGDTSTVAGNASLGTVEDEASAAPDYRSGQDTADAKVAAMLGPRAGVAAAKSKRRM